MTHITSLHDESPTLAHISSDAVDSFDELAGFTDDVLTQIGQHNDTLSPVINVIRDKVEHASTVFPHTSDPPSIEPTIETSLLHTDRPPDLLQLLDTYSASSHALVADTNGIIKKLSPHPISFSIHHDSGANRSVTNQRSILHSITPVTSLNIKGANKDSGFLTCSEQGIFNLQCRDGIIIPVPVYITDDVEGTILSPTDICLHNYNNFSVWEQRSEIDSNTGSLTFLSTDNSYKAIVDLKMENGLWFSHQAVVHRPFHPQSSNAAYVKTMTAEAEYELWHQRLCHPGQKVMEKIHHAVEGVPELKSKRHAFYHCDTCVHSKIQKRNRNKSISTKTNSRGERFHMDFGFVRGEDHKEYNSKLRRFITSIDGFNSYLIIVDSFTRYTWIYLTSTKEPPIDLVSQFLDDHGLKIGPRFIRTDQGGELFKSSHFRKIAAEKGYTVEPTGSDDSAQNGVAERPNKTFGAMMRALLSNAGLDSKFWSYALRYSVYIKNRTPHAFHDFHITPFEKYTGCRPDLSKIRIFGAPVRVRKPGKRLSKLTNHSYHGRFLEFVGTDKNIRYYDTNSKRVKIASHVVFDEAHFSQKDKPPGAIALYNAGLSFATKTTQSEHLNIDVEYTKLSNHAMTPVLATDGSVGSDLFSAEAKTIPPKSLILFSTNLAIKCPSGTYGRIAPRSGLTTKKHLTVLAGVIDNDYRGDVKVALYNFGDVDQQISVGDKIAQIIFEQIKYPTFQHKNKLDATTRNTDGFGSTDVPKINAITDNISPHIELCDNASGPTIEVQLNIKGTHKTLGLIVDDETKINTATLIHCKRGTPSARIKRWRSTLKNAQVYKIDDDFIFNQRDIENAITKAKTKELKTITISFITSTPIPINPSSGVPSLYYDQMQNITKILQTMQSPTDISITSDGTTNIHHDSSTFNYDEINDKFDPIHELIPEPTILNAIVRHVQSLATTEKSIKKKKKLTRRYLKTLSNWKDWQNAEYTQLDLYHKQNMFKAPVARPKNSNILNLLWAYKIKDDGTLKARCVCNGNPRRKGTVTLDHTYAACLEQPGSRVFWALSAVQGLIVVGADASNAFAEAPAPKAPLYVEIDNQYREWWKSKGKDEIPSNFVLPVNHALQGHPESPRLWSKLIDNIIKKDVGLVPTTHEPCVYSGTIDGVKVYLLRQVDDFAVASTDISICNKVISMISAKLSVPMHNLGILKRFNGIDIHQTQEYIKLSNETYISKVLANYNWLEKEHKQSLYPTPLKDDPAFLSRLDTEKGPDPSTNKTDYIALEEKMGVKYRKLLGELLFCMITCRPDISFPVIKLAKYANSPAEVHYQALKNILRYLRLTIDRGLYYWRITTSHETLLPSEPPPSLFHVQNEHLDQHYDILLGFMDADWAQDLQNRKSVSGIAMFFAGAVVYYKTKYQPTIAHSSTEAEFMSACDAGKISLYLRSILDELGIDQRMATVLYEDNQGALMMGNAQMPTKRTRHMDIKYFSIQQWIEEDLLVLHDIESTNNVADAFTKQLGRILFNKHYDTIMGRKYPTYYRGKYFKNTQTQQHLVVSKS